MPKFTPDTAKTKSHDGKGDPCGPYEAILFSNSGRLTQFGAIVEILPPGSTSSIKHWHQNEDEMIYMLEGEALVYEGELSYTLNAGEVATFKAGKPIGHYIENVGDTPIKYLVIGTRSTSDVVTYPDNDRVLKFERPAGRQRFSRYSYTTLLGKPARSPYKDTV
ncbi:cupin [Rhodobacterales bacterium 52_120_T64]|nr:cupin [Rhodobacterales bacterium 52_120_T64]